jgi:hypothetical protein
MKFFCKYPTRMLVMREVNWDTKEYGLLLISEVHAINSQSFLS